MVARLKRLNKNGMWTWAFATAETAVARNDRQRIAMIRLLLAGGEQMEGDFDLGLDALARGRELAERLGEHWWVILFNHWRLQLLLKKGEYPAARELVMYLVTETRKPRYEGLGLRVCIQEDLIRLCVETDPHGYEQQVSHALTFMARKVTPGTYCYHCLFSSRVDFAKETERWDEAAQGLEYLLNLDADEPRSLAVHYTSLCRLAYERRDWDALRDWSTTGERIAQQVRRADCLAEYHAWQALLACRAGDAAAGDRLAQAAVASAAKSSGKPHRDFYDALCAYYETAGAPERALDARFEHLRHLSGNGRLAHELHTREEIIRLLMAQDKPAKNQIITARKVAQSLIDPAPALARLDQLERGTGILDNPLA